jgi:iron complex outermembrane receptor protein
MTVSPGRWPGRAPGQSGLASLLAMFALTAAAQTSSPQLTDMSLEDLMNIEVTSVSKKEQKLVGAAAAVHVITPEDIRRSGLNSLPEILRLAPGLDVAKIDGNKWAISSRGFNAQFSKMMLVLVDGRTVYLPSNSGVYWDEQEMMVEDIDRIEVIRGPGASLWGANAVNGVINIITKQAADTQGVLLSTIAGDEDRTVTSARYGDRAGGRGFYRVYSNLLRRGDLPRDGDNQRHSDWTMLRGGFRSDWKLSAKDTLTVQGDLYRETAGLGFRVPILTPPYADVFDGKEETAGGNLVANWRHQRSDRSIFSLKGYFDHAAKETRVLLEDRSTLDADFQHLWSGLPRHEIVWGMGFRYNVTSFRNSATLAFLPERRTQRLASGFVQDEIRLIPETLSVIVGSKLEHNDFTGAEVQPSVRFVWMPNPRTALWGAVSRAVRTPSYFDEGAELALASFPGEQGLATLLQLFGSEQGRSETLRAHELGYRSQLSGRIAIDWTGFYNVYHDLQTWEPREPFTSSEPLPFHLVLPLVISNGMRGESLGFEMAATWDITPRWRATSAYALLHMQLHLDAASGDFVSESAERKSPRHQAQLRSELDLSRRLQFDASVYYVGPLPALAVPAYTRLDARLGWRPLVPLEISVGGQNLQGGLHLEYISEGPFAPSRVGRSFYGRATWRF